VFSPKPAQAQYYIWSPSGGGAGCANMGGPILCVSPAESCAWIALSLYHPDPTGLFLTPNRGNTTNVPWACHYQWSYIGTQVVGFFCGGGFTGDNNSFFPCSPPNGVMHGRDIGSPCCQNSDQQSAGEPIGIGSGNVFEEFKDFETAGQNKLRFVRYYNSRIAFSGGLGMSWRHNFDRYLIIKGGATPTEVDAERADGRKLTFTPSGSNWVAASDVDVKLTQSGTSWTLTDTDDTVETYTTNSAGDTGVLNTITARNGYAQTMSYNGNGWLSSVTDSYSRTLTFTYSGALIDTVTTPDGQVLTFGYDASYTVGGGITPVNNRLVSISYNTSPATGQTYSYSTDPNNPLELMSVTDENGITWLSWTYDVYGRGLTSKVGTGSNAEITTIAYNDTDGSRTVTNALGQTETYHFTVMNDATKVTQIDRAATATTAAATRYFTYDTNGYLATVTDWNGNSTHFTNDAHGQPTSITEAYGTGVARTTGITYHATFHVPTQIVTPGATTTFTYDSLGRPLTKTLTDTTTTSSPYSTNGQTRTWTYTWTPGTGLLASVQLPRTDATAKTIFNYNSDGSLHTITDPLGHVTTIGLHNAAGYPTQLIDSNSVYRSLTYDTRLRLKQDILSVAGGGYRTTSYTYDAAEQLIKTTLPDGAYFTNSYDDAHRVSGIGDRDGDSIAYTLDALGNHAQEETKDYTSTTKRQHYGTFDALGRALTDSGGVSGETTTFTYDSNGNVTSVTDPLSHATARSFDALNRLSTSTDAASGVTTTTYDAHDRPLTITAPNGAVTSYVYDGFGDLIQESSPDRGTTVYVFDKDGNLTQKTDGAGAITNQTFDAEDRILTRTFPADSSLNVAFTYDQTGHGKGIDRLTSLTDASGTLSRSYDERGNITSETRVSGGHTLTTSYGYDTNGLLGGITYPSGWTMNYQRNWETQIAIVKTKPSGGSTFTNLASNILHMPFGPFKSIAFSNGITETPTYDLSYRMTNITDASGATNYQNLSYTLDLAGNVKNFYDYVNAGRNQTLGYDVLDRLNSAAGSYGSYTMSYDGNGNRINQVQGATTRTNSYAANSNKLVSVNIGGVQSVGSSATGNITSVPSNTGAASTLTYNKANQLATAVTSTSSTTYTYDAFGQRAIKARAGNPTLYYVYGLNGELLEETDGTNATDYVYVDNRPIGILQGANAYYVHADRIGTVQFATNASKATVWDSHGYAPFGTTGGVTGTISQNLRMPGHYFDAETGYNHNGAREYIGAIQRYAESDPLSLAGGLSTYTYVRNNPFKYTDRSGLYYQCAIESKDLPPLNSPAPEPKYSPDGKPLPPNPDWNDQVGPNYELFDPGMDTSGRPYVAPQLPDGYMEKAVPPNPKRVPFYNPEPVPSLPLAL
jgi:RHS repeat-associated protein